MSRKRWFLLAVALQVVLLLGLAARHQYTVATGAPMLLETVPVDPFDMFRGDYVRLAFAASRVPAPAVDHVRPDEPVWVLFQEPGPGQKYWQAVSASRERPSPGPGQLVVQARARWHEPDGEQRLQVHYGFEQFYVPEGQGLRLEREPKRVDVQVAVDRFGRAAIQQVLWDGQPVEWQ